ncbi:transmembrane protein 176B-like isoform X2 [Ambystoma mexicanum]
MSSNIVKVNGVEVVTDLSKPTIININFNQPSAVHSLLDSAKSVWASKGKSSTVIIKGKQNVVGAMQIIIGLLCVSHAVILSFVREGGMYWAGSGFWTGFPFILTGAVAIHSERRASCFWRSSALLLHLVSLGVAIGGMVIISGDLNPYMWSYWGEGADLCKPQRNYYYRQFYETTTPEPYDWRVERCKASFNNLLNMFNGMKIVVLMYTSLALILSLYSLGYGIKTLFCASGPEEEEATSKDEEPLLTAQPPPYVEKQAKVESI